MKKNLRLWDIILMNVTAIIGLRWIPIAAGYGASSILLWILAVLLFFIPLGLVSSELATAIPSQGGMYVWVKKAFGEKFGFITSWFYWVNNLFYYPSLLTFIAVTAAITFKPSLQDNKVFVCGVILFVFWAVTIFNLKGTKVSKWLSNLSGTLGTILPGLVIIILGLAAVLIWKRVIPTDYSLSNWIPKLNSQSNIALLSSLMFAMAGIEITPILAGETESPQKTFPKATFISAIIIAGIYIIATVSMTFIMSPDKIGAAGGIMDAIKLVSTSLNLSFIYPLVAIMIIVGTLGGVSMWIIGPIKMLFESTKEGVLPEKFTRLNKDDMPQNAMIIQAVIITIIVLATSFLPSVSSIYEKLVLMTTITYLLPYIFMFAAFLKLRKMCPDMPRPFSVPGKKVFPCIISLLGTLSVLLAVGLALVPPSEDVILNECLVAGGPILLGLIGYIIFIFYERKNRHLNN